MTETLTYKDTINRVGFTIIDGIKVVQHNCVIDSANPQEMRVTMVKLNAELYKACPLPTLGEAQVKPRFQT